MTRIAPQPVTQKQPVFRDRKWLDSAADRECDVDGCENRATVVFAHMREGLEGGMGLKPDDRLGAFLCAIHHMEQAASPGFEWWAKHILKPQMRRRHGAWRAER